jgi:hypothetical protein
MGLAGKAWDRDGGVVKPLRSIVRSTVLGFSMIGLSTREGLVSTLNEAQA